MSNNQSNSENISLETEGVVSEQITAYEVSILGRLLYEVKLDKIDTNSYNTLVNWFNATKLEYDTPEELEARIVKATNDNDFRDQNINTFLRNYIETNRDGKKFVESFKKSKHAENFSETDFAIIEAMCSMALSVNLTYMGDDRADFKTRLNTWLTENPEYWDNKYIQSVNSYIGELEMATKTAEITQQTSNTNTQTSAQHKDTASQNKLEAKLSDKQKAKVKEWLRSVGLEAKTDDFINKFGDRAYIIAQNAMYPAMMAHTLGWDYRKSRGTIEYILSDAVSPEDLSELKVVTKKSLAEYKANKSKPRAKKPVAKQPSEKAYKESEPADEKPAVVNNDNNGKVAQNSPENDDQPVNDTLATTASEEQEQVAALSEDQMERVLFASAMKVRLTDKADVLEEKGLIHSADDVEEACNKAFKKTCHKEGDLETWSQIYVDKLVNNLNPYNDKYDILHNTLSAERTNIIGALSKVDVKKGITPSPIYIEEISKPKLTFKQKMKNFWKKTKEKARNAWKKVKGVFKKDKKTVDDLTDAELGDILVKANVNNQRIEFASAMRNSLEIEGFTDKEIQRACDYAFRKCIKDKKAPLDINEWAGNFATKVHEQLCANDPNVSHASIKATGSVIHTQRIELLKKMENNEDLGETNEKYAKRADKRFAKENKAIDKESLKHHLALQRTLTDSGYTYNPEFNEIVVRMAEQQRMSEEQASANRRFGERVDNFRYKVNTATDIIHATGDVLEEAGQTVNEAKRYGKEILGCFSKKR